ncbi:MAG TPA: GNAT family N-acetyltransferase [Planctomycetota bacterium]|nr:GNAT family N-acetyltransferase [Planctomycetota bacterium]
MMASDIPDALRLCAAANWNQTEADWQWLLAFEPDGCFAAEFDGALAGTATTTRYEPARGPGSFAWIGMMLVNPAQRRSGIGSALLSKCIEFLEDAGVETIKLDATALGKKVYDTFGFRDEYLLERWEGPAQALAADCARGCEIEMIREMQIDELSAFDAPIFGAQRRRVLQAWRAAWPECAIAARINGALAGYALARRGARFQQIGPVIGRSPEICEALLRESLARFPSANVVVDLAAQNSWTKQIAERCGLKCQRPLIRMARGPNASPGQMEHVLAICCPELG